MGYLAGGYSDVGGAGGVYGGARVFLRPLLGDGGDLADVRRVLSLESPAARGLAFFTVDDQGTVERQGERVGCGHGHSLNFVVGPGSWVLTAVEPSRLANHGV